MNIAHVRLTPIRVPYRKPYYWAQGVIEAAEVILVEIETNTGVIGYGETIATPNASAMLAYMRDAADHIIGRDPYHNARLMAECYHRLFQAFGTCSAPRFAGQVLAGLEMALWDVMGKAAGQPVHALLGGAVHDTIRYFGFPQGATPEEIAAEAGEMVKAGFGVIYVKVGQSDAIDLEIIRQTREAIGPDARLRLDPNEHWPGPVFTRMIRKIAPYDIDFIEQPCDAESLPALARIKASSPFAIAADQAVFTPYDALAVVQAGAADVITLGLHETGGITRFLKCARIAEAAGIPISLHGLYETGITTCATHQAGAVIPNLDDGNQYMAHFLEWDVIEQGTLTLQGDLMPVLSAPGLGFTLDDDAVRDAAKLHAAAQ